ncbi:MAG: N-formylglutamate amidohydrolase [Rhodospirillales bacterium]|nr:N-formylglutamate amidohydrolase [Rhodospirillales bacterium]
MNESFTFTEAVPDRCAPLLFSSPHSGRHYPEDWQSTLTRAELRLGEDAYVDDLLTAAPGQGVALLAAHYPRCYIDLNRAEGDLDPALLADPWPGELAPGEKTRMGLGLIRRYVVPGLTINPAPLPSAEIARRIATIHRPYHARLRAELEALRARFGHAWMIDWHSMKSIGNAMTPDGAGARRPDFVLGDRDGTSCTPRLTALAADTLSGMGYRITINDPYKGGTITQRYGRPADGLHALQIEMNRALYLHEPSVTVTAGFDSLKRNLGMLTEVLAKAAREG